MKRTLFLLVFLSVMDTFAQRSIPDDTYFECVSGLSRKKDSCGYTFYSFGPYHSFYAFAVRGDHVEATTGVYLLTDGWLDLRFSGLVTYKHTLAGYIYYSDSVFSPYTAGFQTGSDTQVHLFGSLNGSCECLKTEVTNTGWAEDLFPDHQARLLMMDLRNTSTLIGLDTYSPERDDDIMEAYLMILDSSYYVYDETDNSLHRSAGGMQEAEVFYAPDSAFKIFSFSGEDCGAHCNGSYVSIAQFPSGKFVETGFARVNGIYKTGNDDHYVVLHSGWSGGTMSSASMCMNLVRLETDSLYPGTFEFDSLSTEHYLGLRFDEKESVIFYAYWFIPCRLSMEFNATSNRVFYSYGFGYADNISKEFLQLLPVEYYPAENEALCVEGEFTLKNNRISGHTIRFSLEKME